MSPVPIQGDAKRLEQLASGVKRSGGTFGPVVQRTPAGRPVGTGGTPAPRESKQQNYVNPEHKPIFDEVARAEWTRQYWERMAQLSPTPWVQGMLSLSERNAETAAAKAYDVVPNMAY